MRLGVLVDLEEIWADFGEMEQVLGVLRKFTSFDAFHLFILSSPETETLIMLRYEEKGTSD